MRTGLDPCSIDKPELRRPIATGIALSRLPVKPQIIGWADELRAVKKQGPSLRDRLQIESVITRRVTYAPRFRKIAHRDQERWTTTRKVHWVNTASELSSISGLDRALTKGYFGRGSPVQTVRPGG